MATAAFSGSQLLYESGSSAASVIGFINFDLYWDFQALLKAHPNIQTIYIDSNGGAAASAVVMADLIHDRKLNLIVDGLCASSCASYLFPAAIKKSVEAGSIVAIHATAWYGDADSKVIVGSGNEMESAIWSDAIWRIFEPDGMKRLNLAWKSYQFSRNIRDFEQRHHFKPVFEDSFAAYLTRRKKLLGLEDVGSRPGSRDCPRISAWALSKAQLESMGIQGIGKFWYPKDKDEQSQQSGAFGQTAGSIFFGDKQQFDRFCSTSVVAR